MSTTLIPPLGVRPGTVTTTRGKPLFFNNRNTFMDNKSGRMNHIYCQSIANKYYYTQTTILKYGQVIASTICYNVYFNYLFICVQHPAHPRSSCAVDFNFNVIRANVSLFTMHVTVFRSALMPVTRDQR